MRAREVFEEMCMGGEELKQQGVIGGNIV